MAKAKRSNQIKYQEAPMGVGNMGTKQSTDLPAGGGPKGGMPPAPAPSGKSMPDGTGAMKSQNEDPGYDAKRMDIGATVPKSRHAKGPL